MQTMVFKKHGFHIGDNDGVDPQVVADKVLATLSIEGIDETELHNVISNQIAAKVGMNTLMAGTKVVNVSYTPYGKLTISESI